MERSLERTIERASKVSGRPAIAWEDALELPAALLPDLPMPPRIALHVPGIPEVVRVELAGEPSDGLTLDAEEWRALVVAAEADRVWPRDLVALLARKRTASSERPWRIDRETALAGAQPDPFEAWSAREVLARLGAVVLSIELGDGS